MKSSSHLPISLVTITVMNIISLLITVLLLVNVIGFEVVFFNNLQQSLPTILDHSSLYSKSSIREVSDFIFVGYQNALRTDALRTQVATGVALAVSGDAVAQKVTALRSLGPHSYDRKRAISFAAFDGGYRTAQHYLYPLLIAMCQGNVIGPLLPTDYGNTAAAMEQALVSQLVIIPALYYPAFFAVTGFVQGLSIAESFERARISYIPLMRRNWIFWIPVQFLVFSVVQDEATQISILIVAGFLWTVFLSLSAGQVTPATREIILPQSQTNLSKKGISSEEMQQFAFQSANVVSYESWGCNTTNSDPTIHQR